MTKADGKDNNTNTINGLSSTEFNIVIGGSLPFDSVLLTATNRLGMSNLLDKPIDDSTWANFTTEWTAAYRFK